MGGHYDDCIVHYYRTYWNDKIHYILSINNMQFNWVFIEKNTVFISISNASMVKCLQNYELNIPLNKIISPLFQISSQTKCLFSRQYVNKTFFHLFGTYLIRTWTNTWPLTKMQNTEVKKMYIRYLINL